MSQFVPKSIDQFKPMLALDALKAGPIQYPAYISPKYDGIRCVIRGEGAKTRKLLPIPNDYIRTYLSRPQFKFLDGELIVGDPTSPNCWNVTQSGIMSRDGNPDWRYFVFDNTGAINGFDNRLERLVELVEELNDPRIILTPQVLVRNETEMMHYESLIVGMGYEGIIVRPRDSGYFWGRASKARPWLLKLKRFVDAEALVVGAVERLHNGNEKTTDELGHAKRSSHKANKTPNGTMGALVCHFNKPEDEIAGVYNPVEFEIGTGFDEAQRAEFWANPPIGKMVKFKFQKLSPIGKPIFPVYLGIRDERDM